MSQEFGLYYGLIQRIGPYRRPAKIDWSAVDWSKSDPSLAKVLSVTSDTVRIRRKQLAPESKIGKRRPTYDWSQADWSKRDVEIARDLRCHPETVAFHRRKIRAGQPSGGTGDREKKK